jgi:polyphenol oxidase
MDESLSDLLWVRENLNYFRYPNLFLNPQLVHGVFTRHGGISEAPYHSLNISYTVGDTPDNVTLNHHTIKETIGANHLIFMNQSHGTDILVFHKGQYARFENIPSADAIITDVPFFALMVQLADCQGVILFDPKKNVVANVHCGWRGNVQNILERVVIRMKKEFGCRESNLLAGISPSLGPCCAEFVSHKEIFPDLFKRFMVRENYFDLWAISRWQLESAGLRGSNIEIAGICTRCRSDLFYSYRGEGKTGRFGAVAMLI